MRTTKYLLLRSFSALILLSLVSAFCHADLVMYWPFNEGSGTDIHDSSGYGVWGSLWAEDGGTLPQWVSSVDSAHGTALRFGDYLGAAAWCYYNAHLDLATNWTIAFWSRQDQNADPDHGGYSRVMSAENYEIELGEAGDNYAYSWAWNSASWQFPMAASPALGAWHHIALTYDGTTFREYIDGTSSFTKTGLPSSLPRYASYPWDCLAVGVQADFPSSNHMVGALDDIAIWNETLTQTQINTAKGGDFSNWTNRNKETAAVSYFDFRQSDVATECWDGGRTYVYIGSPATFTTCGDHTVPIDITQGSGVLALTTTYTGGWWNAWFTLDWGHSVNYLRYGLNPSLYLRVKWGAIATGADTKITLRDNTDIWNLLYEMNGTTGPYAYQEASVYLSSYVTPSTTTWQDVYIPLSAFIANNPNIDLTRISELVLGNGASTYSATNTLYIQKMKLVPNSSFATGYSDMIKINQWGYPTTGRKLAFVSYEIGTVATAPTTFQLKNSSGSVVYTGSLTAHNPGGGGGWDYSNDKVFDADFTSYTTAGTYTIYCSQLGQTSPAFTIGTTNYNQPLRDALRFFYYARSGNAIAEPAAEGHTRPTLFANTSACAYDYDDNDATHMYDYDPGNIGITTRDVQGGWFDAGDLHLDVHNNVVTLWFLLQTLQDFQSKVPANSLNLPESDGSTNDLVLLIKYQLDWFKKMQNSDGSVHFMVITEGTDKSVEQVSDVSTGAACILSGIFAKAYTVLNPISGQAAYAADLLTRAQSSWTWLQAHPATYDPLGSNGQPFSYGITDDTSFRSFAAIELYIATGTTSYKTFFETAFNTNGNGGDGVGGDAVTAYGSGWSNYYGYIQLIGGIEGIVLGYLDYVSTTRTVNTTIKNNIIADFTTEAADMLAHNGYNPYHMPMLMSNDLSWGSTGYLCGNAYIMLKTYQWNGNIAYKNAAIDVLDYMGGRNPVARNFITGHSDYMHGTDAYSFCWYDHINEVPGYLCGNINAFGFDWGQHSLGNYIRGPYKYYQNIQTASLLEPCLPWQAEACYLLAYFSGTVTAPAVPKYTERANSFAIGTASAWTDVDLTNFGVGANTTVEIGICNNSTSTAYSAGVRIKGSSIDRRVTLHYAATAGTDTVTMQVKTDANRKIQAYAGSTTNVRFYVLGVWNRGTYVEKYQTLTISTTGAWTDSADLSTYGVAAGNVVEIMASNTSTSTAYIAGVRAKGSALTRSLTLHPATTSANECIVMQAVSDSSRKIQVYKGNTAVTFVLLGYWSTNPGTFTEKFADVGKSASSATWTSRSLTGQSVPAGAICSFLIANASTTNHDNVGVRKTGSVWNGRLLDIHKSSASTARESCMMHVPADASSNIEQYLQNSGDTVNYYLLGYWN